MKSSPHGLYDRDDLIAELSSANAILRRYLPGADEDEPLMWFDSSNFSTPRSLHADAQSSIIGWSDEAGNSGGTIVYGPYGERSSWTGPRYSYTGQIELPETSLYYYKARIYDPGRGWFLQTDTVGYQDDLNFYRYVRNDPLNSSDPTGTDSCDAARQSSSPVSCSYGAGHDLNSSQPSKKASSTAPSADSPDSNGGDAPAKVVASADPKYYKSASDDKNSIGKNPANYKSRRERCDIGGRNDTAGLYQVGAIYLSDYRDRLDVHGYEYVMYGYTDAFECNNHLYRDPAFSSKDRDLFNWGQRINPSFREYIFVPSGQYFRFSPSIPPKFYNSTVGRAYKFPGVPDK